MARDRGLEELVSEDLAKVPGLSQKAMFGGWAWLVNGNLLCGARDDGLLARLGRGNDAWALGLPGIVPMLSRGREMQGWVRATSRAWGDDKLRRKLIAAALEFNATVPAK